MLTIPAVPIWKSAPFLRITPPFLLGVVSANFLSHPKELALILLCIPAFYLSVTFRHTSAYHFRFGALNGWMINLTLAATGLFSVGHQDIRRHPDWLGYRYMPGDFIVVTLMEPLRAGKKSYYTKAKVNGLLRSGKFIPSKGRVYLTLSKQLPTTPEWGDVLILSQPIESLHRSGNPGGYDRNASALRQQFYHHLYLGPSDVKVLYHRGPPVPGHLIAHGRQKLIYCLQKFIPGKKESGLAEALLFGYKQDLDPETVADYTSSGIVHVIAISGMHLGIIYLLLHHLFEALPGRRHAKGLKALLTLTGIWGFSILAGSGPSVLRSAVMYSSLIIGGSIKRNTHPLNALFASAFLLVCIRPEMIYDPGFQLSYLAVLGLLLYYQRIRRTWYIKHKWIRYCWNLVSLSLAAQLFTFPVSLFHFHQFPTYFLPANLIAVPFSSILLIGILLLVLISPVTPVATLLGKALLHATHLLNECVHFFAGLPWGTWQPLQIGFLQCILFYLLLLLPLIRFSAGVRKKLQVAYGLLFWIVWLRFHSYYKAATQNQLIIYDIPKSSRMEWHIGRTAYYWNGDTTTEAASSRTINPCRDKYRIQKVIFSPYDPATPFLQLGSLRILRLDHYVSLEPGLESKPVGLLVLSGRAQCNDTLLLRSFSIQQAVIDRTVSRYRAKQWTEIFKRAGIPCHNIVDKGAFVMKLP